MAEVRIFIKAPNANTSKPNVLDVYLEICATNKKYKFQRSFLQCDDAAAVSRALRSMADEIDKEVK